MAVQAGVPIVPVVISNYYEIYSAKEKRFNAGTLRCRGKKLSSILIYIYFFYSPDFNFLSSFTPHFN